MPREFSRHQRLGHQVQRTLAELLQFEVKDPRVRNVSLTSVELSRDLGLVEEHRVIHQTWDKRRGYYRALGFVFLGTGLLLLGLMIYALLSRLGH